MAKKRVKGWQTRPVFITSTFRDMQRERDWLRNPVLLELEARLKERRHHLEPIDLRWGVDPEETDESTEQSREFMVLKVCLDEVERSRPFLIGLIGDRYGWVPPKERMKAAAKEAGFKEDVAGRSVTDMEIAFGVLQDPEQAKRSLFFFRDPLPYDDMPPDIAAQYSEAHNPETGPEVEERLEALKARIKKELPGQVHHYTAKWDAKLNRVVDLKAWGEIVLEALWDALDAETAEYARAEAATWQEEEAWALEAFIENRGRGFVGRDDILENLTAHALSLEEEGAEWGLCVTGPAGQGKSALFAELHKQLEKEDILLLAHAAGIGPRSTQVDAMLRRWISELAEHLKIEGPLAEDASMKDVEEAFRSLMSRTSVNRRVVILIDALNQFEPTTRARHMTWLPRLWPANARFIATAIPGDQSEALVERPGAALTDLPPLDEFNAAKMAQGICDRYHRDLNRHVVDALLAKRREDGTPAAGNPLWLELAVEALNLLDADDFERMDKEFEGDDKERLDQLLLTMVDENFPPEVADLYGWLLTRAEDLHGEAWARAFVNLIAISRAGWRESDLEALIPKLTGEDWDPLKFAALRRTFRAHVVQKGEHAQWDFTHSLMREAVFRHNLEDEEALTDKVKDLHTLLADHLLVSSENGSIKGDDPLHESESMVHLFGADDQIGAAEYYGGTLTNGEEAGATQVLAELILDGRGEDTNSALGWVISLLEAPDIEDGIVAGLCKRLIFALYDEVKQQAPLDLLFTLSEATRNKLSTLSASDPANADWQRDLSISHGKIGDNLRVRGDLRGALSAFEAGLEIIERPGAFDRDNAEWQRDQAFSHERIGDILRAQGNLEGALSAFEAALKVAKRLATSNPDNTEWQRDLSIGYLKVGDIVKDRGDLAAAHTAYEAGLEVRESLAASAPDNAGWQRDLSISQNKIGEILLALGDLGGALSAFEAGLKIRERLAVSDPGNFGWQRDLSVSFERLGNIFATHGDFAEALSSFEAAQEIAKRLTASDPANTEWQRDLSVSQIKIGDILSARGDLASAHKAFQVSQDILERLAATDPANTVWQRDLSVSHLKIGDILKSRGDLEGALSAFEAGLEIAGRLAASDPANTQWQRDLSASHNMIGDILLAQGDLERALSTCQASHDIFERLAASDLANAGWQHDLSVSHHKIANILKARGDLGGALSSFEAALEIAERLVASEPANVEWQRSLVISNFKLAGLFQQTGDQVDATYHWKRCHQILQDMKTGGIHLDRPLAELLEQLGSLL